MSNNSQAFVQTNSVMSSNLRRFLHSPKKLYHHIDERKNELEDVALYLKAFDGFKPLTDQKEFEGWFNQYKNGSTEALRLQARDVIVYGNIRLVAWIAAKRYGRGLPFVDLMQEGLIGLMEGALPNFDPSKSRFSTYAVWWIRQGMSRAIYKMSYRYAFRMQVTMIDRDSLIQRTINELEREKESPPNNYEVLIRIRTHNTVIAQKTTLEEVYMYRMTIDTKNVSLNYEYRAQREDDEDYQGVTPLDVMLVDKKNIVAGTAKSVAESLARTVSSLTAAVKALPERYGHILSLRLGIDINEPRTLQSVAAEVGLTRERVRQIQNKAVAYLRARGLGVDFDKLLKLFKLTKMTLGIIDKEG